MSYKDQCIKKFVSTTVTTEKSSIYHALNCSSNTYSDSDSCSGEAVGAAQTLVFDIPTDIEQSVSALLEVEHLSIILLVFVLFS